MSNTAFTLSIKNSQVAIFFTAFGVGLFIACISALEQRSEYGRSKVIGCVSATLVGSLTQIVMSIIFYFKEQHKKTWIYVNVFLILLYPVCATVLLADNLQGTSGLDLYHAVTIINWVFIFVIVGFMSNNTVPLGVIFSMLAIGVFLTSCLVIDDFRHLSGTNTGNKVLISASVALVTAVVQLALSLLLFYQNGKYKKTWMYSHTIIVPILVVCFALPLALNVTKVTVIEYYYALTAVDFASLFVVVVVFLRREHCK